MKETRTYVPFSQEELAKYEIMTPGYEKIERKQTETTKIINTPRFVNMDGIFINPDAELNQTAKIMCTGDLLGEPSLQKAAFNGETFDFFGNFNYVKDIFKTADLVVGNLETTICTTAPYSMEQNKVDGIFHCNAPLEYLEALRYAGYDILTNANNHCLDCGIEGLQETRFHLSQLGFGSTGSFLPEDQKRHIIVNVNGIKVGIVAYSTWFNRKEKNLTEQGRTIFLNPYSNERVVRDISTLKEDGAEFVLAYMHWGIDADYKHQLGKYQKNMAQAISDAGADYIIGSHPHVLQEYDVLKSVDGRNVPVVYSLGNFMTSDHQVTRNNIILTFSLKRVDDKIKIIDESYIPCHVFTEYNGKNYVVIPTLDELNGNIANETLETSYKLAKEILKEKINPMYEKPIQNTKYNIIDTHLHFLDYSQNTAGFEKLVQNMDEANVTHAVLFGLPLVKQWDEHEPNKPIGLRSNYSKTYYFSATDYILQQYLQQNEKIKERFFPFICGINPTDKNAANYIKQILELFPNQFYGIGEIMSRHDDLTNLTYGEIPRADHPALLDVYDLAAEQNLPVLIHHNISAFHMKEPIYLNEMEKALSHNRKTKIIWAHIGAHRHVSVPNMLDIVDRMLTSNDNLFCEISIMFSHYIRKDFTAWAGLIEKYPNRFMLGTDVVGNWNAYDAEVRKFDNLINLLSEKAANKLCSENILDLVLPLNTRTEGED